MRRLTLKRLDNASIAELSETMLGEAGRLPEIVDLLQRETEGNIFFLVEVVRVLAEDAGRLEQVGALTLPEHIFTGGVKRVVYRRLSLVPEEHRALLPLAAILGRRLDLEVLRAAQPTADLNGWLAACADAAVLEVIDGAWRFAHDKLREALLEDLPPDRKRALHAEALRAIENVYGADPARLAQHTPALAHHAAEAQDVTREARYAAAAGAQEVANCAFREAIPLLQRALILHEPHESDANANIARAHICRMLGEAHLAIGEIVVGRNYLEQALALLGYGLPPHEWLVGGLIGQVAGRLARISGLRRPKARAQGDPQRAVLLDASAVYGRLSELAYFGNQFAPGLYAVLRATQLGEAAGPSPELARAYASISIGVGLSTLPLDRLARYYARRALAVCEQIDDPGAEGYVRMLIGLYYAGIGGWQDAESNLTASIALSARAGDQRRVEQAQTTRGHIAAIRGSFQQCVAINREVYASARRRGDEQMQASGLLWEAAALVMLGDLDMALLLLDKARPLYVSGADQGLEIVGYSTQAVAQVRLGRNAEAMESGSQALALLSGPPTSFSALPVLAGLAGMYLNLWERNPQGVNPAVLSATQKAVKALRDYSRVFPIGWPYAHVMQGWSDWLTGTHDSARKQWIRAMDSAEALDMPYPLARSYYEIGKHAGSFTDRQRYLLLARSLFAELSAQVDSDRAARLLEMGH
jgi:tetratricopeptide (TPR) repeat protein